MEFSSRKMPPLKCRADLVPNLMHLILPNSSSDSRNEYELWGKSKILIQFQKSAAENEAFLRQLSDWPMSITENLAFFRV